MNKRLFPTALLLLLLLLPVQTWASVVETIEAIDPLGNTFDATFGGIALFLRERMLLLIDAVALFLLVRAGLKLIQSQEDDKLTTAKRTIGGTAVGIMLAHLSVRLVEIFYGFTAAPTGGVLTPGTSSAMLTLEISGIIRWVTTLVAVLGVLMIVATAIRAIGGFGKEDGLKNLKETVFGTVTGIFFITISGAIKLTFGLPEDLVPGGPHDPTPFHIIDRIGEITNTILDYLAIVAVAIVIYAGFLMIFSVGDEEQFKKGRTLIFRALIGLVIILLSNTFASFLIDILTD